VIIPALVAPVLAFVVAGMAIITAYVIVRRRRPGHVNRGYRLGQWLSSGLLALSHGTNDAQKTMGIITLASWRTGTSARTTSTCPTGSW
jgi:PiT family inorganic phosphate transporter